MPRNFTIHLIQDDQGYIRRRLSGDLPLAAVLSMLHLVELEISQTLLKSWEQARPDVPGMLTGDLKRVPSRP